MGNALEKVSDASENRTKYLVIIVSTVLGVSLLLVFGLFVVITRKKQSRQKHLAQLRGNLNLERRREQAEQVEDLVMERSARWHRSKIKAQAPQLDLEVANVFQNPDYGRGAVAATITPTDAPGFGYPSTYIPYGTMPPSHSPPNGSLNGSLNGPPNGYYY